MTPLARAHKWVEHHTLGFIAGILLISSVGGLVQILPLVFEPPGAKREVAQARYSAAELAGREVYIRESCGLCHSQQVRPLLGETRRYGDPSVPEEFMYDRPFLWGSKRTGPDLARLAGKYSDEWHRVHLRDPRSVVPSSIMPAYPWLDGATVDPVLTQRTMVWMRRLGVPYTDEEVAAAIGEVGGMSEMDALVAYLQSLGRGAP